LPLGSTHAFSRRIRTTAKRGLVFPRKTMPPAARIGAGLFAESVMPFLCRTQSGQASSDSREHSGFVG
jgi:hypothetical protein